MPLSESEITEAYRKLSQARQAHWQANEQLFLRKAELLRARAQRVSEGLIDGRNESERDAQARQFLGDLFTAIEDAEIEERRAAIGVELCRVEIERIQTLLRFLALGPKEEDF